MNLFDSIMLTIVLDAIVLLIIWVYRRRNIKKIDLSETDNETLSKMPLYNIRKTVLMGAGTIHAEQVNAKYAVVSIGVIEKLANIMMQSFDNDKPTDINAGYNSFLQNYFRRNESNVILEDIILIAEAYSRFCVPKKTQIKIEMKTVKIALIYCQIDIAYFLCKRYKIDIFDILQFNEMDSIWYKNANRRITALAVQLIDDEISKISNKKSSKPDELHSFIYALTNRIVTNYAKEEDIFFSLLQILVAEHRSTVKKFFIENKSVDFIEIEKVLFGEVAASTVEY